MPEQFYGGWDYPTDPYAGQGWNYDFPGGEFAPYDPYAGMGWGGDFDFSGGDQSFLDTQTGLTYKLSQILADPALSQPFQRQMSSGPGNWLPGGNVINAPGGSIPPSAPTVPWYRDPSTLALGAIGLPTLLGLGGLVQGLTSGGQRATTVNQPTYSPLSGAAGQAALQGLQGAQQFAFGGGQPGTGQPGGGGFGGGGGGLAGQLQAMAPYQQAASLQSLARLLQQNNPFTQQLGASGPSVGGLGPVLEVAAQNWPNYFPGGATHPDAMTNLQNFMAWEHQTPQSIMGDPAYTAEDAQTGSQGGNPLLNQLGQLVQGYGQAQQPLLGLAGLGALGIQNPAAGALGQQAQGMAQGSLPALNPMLRAQVGATFEPQRQEIARYLDQALQGAMERSRQQGFAGGTEIFREGTPAALLAPGLAEATRQQGVLGGQQAMAELALAQALPQLGGNIANQLVQQQLAASQNLQQAAAGYTTPMSVALSGGLNLSNLNQNIVQQLGAFGQQGMGNQLDFLRAISAPLSGLSGLSGAAQAGAGSTSTQTQPFNLLSAFAPTASLLGGIGGAMTGYGAMTNPAQYRYPAQYGG